MLWCNPGQYAQGLFILCPLLAPMPRAALDGGMPGFLLRSSRIFTAGESALVAALVPSFLRYAVPYLVPGRDGVRRCPGAALPRQVLDHALEELFGD